MTLSENIFPRRLTRIDELTLDEHHHLTAEDACYFLGEYTARQGYQHSETNRLIYNLKKPMDRRNLPEWKYKEKAIQQVASSLRASIAEDKLTTHTFVPVPPSRTRDDPLYDDRMVNILNAVKEDGRVDVRELLLQRKSVVAAHDFGDRPGPAEIEANWKLDISLVDPTPQCVAIVDDVLTTGAHFCTAKSILAKRFGEIPIIGLFVARRALPSTFI